MPPHSVTPPAVVVSETLPLAVVMPQTTVTARVSLKVNDWPQPVSTAPILHTALQFPSASAPDPVTDRLFAVIAAAPFSVTDPPDTMRTDPAVTLLHNATLPPAVSATLPALVMPAVPHTEPTVSPFVFRKHT